VEYDLLEPDHSRVFLGCTHWRNTNGGESCIKRLQLASSKRWSLENSIRDHRRAFASFENTSSRLVKEFRYLELKVERGIHSDSSWMYDPSKWFKFEVVVDKIQATCLRQVLNRREMVRESVLKSYQR